MRFPAAIDLMRRNGRINVAILHFLDFADGPAYVWQGYGRMKVGNVTYSGLGEVVGVDGGGQQAGIVANNLTLTLAAGSDQLTDPLLVRVLGQQSLVKGRRYKMALQFCDDNWQPVDSTRVVYVGVMDQMTVKRAIESRQITLNVESPFVRRRVPRLQLFSVRDQQSKYPADRGLEFISQLENKIVTWPKAV